MNERKEPRHIVLNLAVFGISLLMTLGVFELAFRAGRYLRWDTWEERQQTFVETLTYPFSYGRVRPHVSIADLREYFPSGDLQPNPIAVRTNAFSMRMGEVSIQPASGTVRIAALGDSCTFGWMVREQDSYFRVLEDLLNEGRTARYETLNFGVPGYTSFHGLLQYRRLVKRFHPDWVILAYGFNDSYEFRFSEKEFYQKLKARNLTEGLSGWALGFYDHSGLGNWLIRRIKSFDKNAIEKELIQRAQEGVWHARVSREDYQQNLREMAEDVRATGAKVIFLHLDLPNTWVKESLRQLAEELDIQFLDIQYLYEQYADEQEEKMRGDKGLQPAGTQGRTGEAKRTLLFRVMAPSSAGPVSLLLNDGGHEWPWKIDLVDDGTHGDERSGDGVWSVETEIGGSGYLDYTFVDSAFSAPKSAYENSAKALRFYYHIDRNKLPENSFWISPVHIWDHIPYGRLMIEGDPIHPNPEGHRLIAERLRELIEPSN